MPNSLKFKKKISWPCMHEFISKLLFLVCLFYTSIIILEWYILKSVLVSERDASMVKKICCSSRVCRFCFQCPCGSSQLSVTPGKGDPMPSPGLCLHQACTCCTYTYVSKTHRNQYKKKKKKTVWPRSGGARL